jgi:arsenate reductase
MDQQTILFLCPHHAAKSVLASAYFDQLARQHDLPFRAASAGTHPADAVMPAIVALLRTENGEFTPQTPRHVTHEELESSSLIISMGCELADLDVAPEKVEQWNDLPALSEDLPRGRDAIHERVTALVESLKRAQNDDR